MSRVISDEERMRMMWPSNEQERAIRARGLAWDVRLFQAGGLVTLRASLRDEVAKRHATADYAFDPGNLAWLCGEQSLVVAAAVSDLWTSVLAHVEEKGL